MITEQCINTALVSTASILQFQVVFLYWLNIMILYRKENMEITVSY